MDTYFPPFNVNCPPRAKVGDTVYYCSPMNRYAVKRSVVVEIRLNDRDNRYEQVMQNGDIVTKCAGRIYDNSTFHSLESAISHIMATLIEKINRRQVSIDTLIHEQHKQQQVLDLMRKRYSCIEPKRYDYPVPMDFEVQEGLFDFDPNEDFL